MDVKCRTSAASTVVFCPRFKPKQVCSRQRVVREGRSSRMRASKGFGSEIKSSDSTQKSESGAGGREKKSEQAKRITGILGGLNLTLIGDSTDLNNAVARRLAQTLFYAPVNTSDVIREFKGMSVDDLVQKEGPSELGLVEAMVIESLSQHVRCVVSTCGGGIGAAARGQCWRHIFGSVSIWLDINEEDGISRLQDEAYEQSEVHFKIKTDRQGGVLSNAEAEEIASSIIPKLLKALEETLQGDKDLCKKKNLYVRMGCNGGWPDIQLPVD